MEDRERGLKAREKSLDAEMAEMKRPRRTAAEEHRLQVAKSALAKHGDQGIIICESMEN